ncbi:MAG: hypothetical protein J6T10_28890 [Methanobrevibacter sp.]|nr:hypothetical protein [Methanobrevibacter sp.]
MEFNIGDTIKVNVNGKVFNGLILEIGENMLTVIYVGKTNNNLAFAITDIFDKEGNLME